MLAIACVGALVACDSAKSSEPDLSHADIANINEGPSDFPAGLQGPRHRADGHRSASARAAEAACRYQVRPARLREVRRPTGRARRCEGQHGGDHRRGRGQSVHRDRGRDVGTGAGQRSAAELPEGPVHRSGAARAGRGGRGAQDRRRSHTQGAHRVVQTTVDGRPAPASFTTTSRASVRSSSSSPPTRLSCPTSPWPPSTPSVRRDLLTAAVAAVKG